MSKTTSIKYKKDFHGEIKTYTMNILDEDGVYFTITCFDENGKEMGHATCILNEDSLWLNKIETYKEYAHQGIGSAIIDIVEYLAMQKRKPMVDGKYYPLNEYAKPFYEKHGWFIPNQKGGWDNYDETWHMFKDLDFKKIKSEISRNIEVCEENEDENI